MHRRVLVAAAVAVLAGCGTGGPHTGTGATYRLDLHSGSRGAGTPATPVVGALQPGVYTPETFQPAMSFTVDDGWALAYETPEHLLMFVGDPELPGSAYFFGVSSGTMVTATPVADSTSTAPPSEPFPEDYETWLRAVPHIQVGPRRGTEIGGARGFAVDVDTSGLPEGTCNSVEPATSASTRSSSPPTPRCRAPLR